MTLKRPLKILLTSVGCPGAPALIRRLKNNGEREITIIGIDMNPYATGFNMVDSPYIVPPANDEDYIQSLLTIIEEEQPNILFPQSSSEVGPISRNKKKFENLDVNVMVSKPEPIEICNNKYELFEFLKSRGLKTPEYYYPKDLDEFQECAKLLGFPNKRVCFKPHISKGSRGFRIIDPEINKVDILMNQLPFNRFMSMNEFVEMFQDIDLPQFLLMEYLEGPECTVDTLVSDGETLLATVKTREKARSGLAMIFKTLNRPDLESYSEHAMKELGLDYCINVQFKGEHLIEINPRVSTFAYQDDLVLPYLALKWLLGEITKEELAAQKSKIQYGRITIRYYEQYGVKDFHVPSVLGKKIG
ncbi:MAG: ATP-grasp domain-containing protein [Candidatus Heimdallarchaeota archaeon]|nr:MAG: ATP-grasp domain-containing protein [Candidatus Heimdallarchaeota archaeon]